MKKWIILLITVLVLFLFSRVQENFQPTDKIKGPPYQQADYDKIAGMMSDNLVTKLGERFKQSNPNKVADKSSPENRKNLVDGIISDLFGRFFNTVYSPASEAITKAKVDVFMQTESDPFVQQNAGEITNLLVKYFVDQPAGAANPALTQAQQKSANVAQQSGYLDVLNNLESSTTGSGSGSGGSFGTTGGSNTSYGSTAGGSGALNVWGPTFQGFGSATNPTNQPIDTTGKNAYPTLLGPNAKPSTLLPGAGIVNPTQPGINAPSSAGLGSNENSQYFPTSRVPGDMDLIPDPYRVSNVFSMSNYSSKTEPTPFLTDFSAFQK